mgnify:CR=1 FL=1
MFLNSLTDVNISERWKETILKFCERNNIEIPEQFWYVGNLKQSIMILSTPFSNNSPSLEGMMLSNNVINLYKNCIGILLNTMNI